MPHVPSLVWCLLSSLLLWLSFFPFDLGVLAWVALVPLMPVLQHYLEPGTTRVRWYDRPLFSAWLGGLVFCLVAFQWIRLASPPMYATWIVLALAVSALQWPMFFLFTRLLVQTVKAPLVVAVPITWTALEYMRSQIYIGFAWYYVGHTQHNERYFTQPASLVGVYGLSFMIVMVNVGLWRCISQRSLKVVSLELVPAVILVGLACWYGLGQEAGEAFYSGGRPRTKKIAILQGNQPQDLRNTAETWKQVDQVYDRLGNLAAEHQPALIVAPETCLSFTWFRFPNDQLPHWASPKLVEAATESRQWAIDHATRWKTHILLGWNTYDFTVDPLRHTNSAILLDPLGRERGCYDKIVCLPFGEYIPLADVLPFMRWLSPYDHEYAIRPGTQVNALHWDGHRVGALICYEDTVPDIVRAFMRTQSPHFFVNLSNDGWFKGSEEHEQHLVCARFRCIETRRSMVRAVNMGISCNIDGFGRIIALPHGAGNWQQAKNREAVIVGTVPLYDEETFYTRWGDLLPWGCWLVITVTFLVSFVRRAKTPHAAAAA